MKRCLLKIIIITLIIVFGAHYSNLVIASSGLIDTDINSSNLKEFNPNQSGANKKEQEDIDKMTDPVVDIITPVVQKVLGIIRLFSGLVMVISLAIFGLYRVLAANPELTKDMGLTSIAPKNVKVLIDAGRVIIIGSILVFSSSSIVELAMNIFL